MGLDGDASLPFQVHVIEDLMLHLIGRKSVRHLQHAIGEGGLAVVDVGDDAEVADVALVHWEPAAWVRSVIAGVLPDSPPGRRRWTRDNAGPVRNEAGAAAVVEKLEMPHLPVKSNT
jgi:hypothetical protein